MRVVEKSGPWVGDDLWIVNTLFSCLCTLDDRHSFVPRWRPSFITELAPEDRCHLNGLVTVGGKIKNVTALASSNSAGGWRSVKAEAGILIDVDANQTVASGFAMPHSPHVYAGRVWLLDSGRGTLVHVDPQNGQTKVVARFPGYTRGLTFLGDYAFIGLSRIRESSTFGGVPIAEDRERLKCGVAVLDLRTGGLAAQFEFKSGVEEIFDVALLRCEKLPALRGPFSTDDGEKTIWVVPSPRE